jgi:signal transduction histidine kinase
MRRLLGVLRTDDGSAGELTPAPGLADLSALAAQAQDGGLSTRLLVDGTPVPVPAGVDVSAYRIVQEALTNVIKHGGPSAAVSLVYAPGELRIEVTDPGDGTAPHRERTSGGHGLLGMRERVAVYGGRVVAGPRPGGGFRVAATLPLTGPQPARQDPA